MEIYKVSYYIGDLRVPCVDLFYSKTAAEAHYDDLNLRGFNPSFRTLIPSTVHEGLLFEQ
jgi:hypothetical protein